MKVTYDVDHATMAMAPASSPRDVLYPLAVRARFKPPERPLTLAGAAIPCRSILVRGAARWHGLMVGGLSGDHRHFTTRPSARALELELER